CVRVRGAVAGYFDYW
nr:immunoglobulin heavy chain junction region [Macaca mulatta]MOW77781.1 immunoglobulin heavy chain junction region [Macaca mulatta]MOW79226.1 immunoglobulin heavy chain junction region [Macaca mulatta]MOW79378.1 immunoglobulin heavy chain junction region [Macaca mulatta]MOW80481.1 immunoglobulin heavy chain junction region [Macaca mulatta]